MLYNGTESVAPIVYQGDVSYRIEQTQHDGYDYVRIVGPVKPGEGGFLEGTELFLSPTPGLSQADSGLTGNCRQDARAPRKGRTPPCPGMTESLRTIKFLLPISYNAPDNNNLRLENNVVPICSSVHLLISFMLVFSRASLISSLSNLLVKAPITKANFVTPTIGFALT